MPDPAARDGVGSQTYGFITLSVLKASRLRDAWLVLKRVGPCRASDFGWAMWGHTTAVPDRGVGSHGHNKFCRSAGKKLRELERIGRARWTSRPGYTLWEAVGDRFEKGGDHVVR